MVKRKVNSCTGLYKCYQCRKPLAVRIGTIFECSHVALHIRLQAKYLIAGSKKGVSANQLHHTLGVILKAAWFMSHRTREAMRFGDFSPFGTDGATVEVDETFIGTRKGSERARSGHAHMMAVLSFVDRSNGKMRSISIDGTFASAIH